MARKDSLDALAAARILEYEYAKSDLGLFAQAAWDVLEPNTELKWNWHHDLICEYLTAAKLGQIRRLIINVCPRSTKSILSTICFPAWVWADQPWSRFLFGSHADDLAMEHSVLRRNLLESDWYRHGYGSKFQLSETENSKTVYANDKTGRMQSAGILGSIIGKGGDYIIIDDPHDPKKAASDPEREKACSNFDLAWSSRLNDKKTGRIIVIMQRLHEKDLTGHLLAKNLGYEHIKIPTICEERKIIHFPISKRSFEREEGELLHPERDGPEQIEQAKQDMGPFGFSGQHQQNPTPSTGGLFTGEMFDFVKMPDLEEFEYTFVTADTAYKDKQENDFTVFSAWGVKDRELYLIDCYRKQIKAILVENDVVPFLKTFNGHYAFRGVWIEPKGHGIYLNQALPMNEECNIVIPGDEMIDDFFSDRKLNKVERANNAAPRVGNRRIHINEALANRETLKNEAVAFPKAAHDDFVDTLVDAIKMAYAWKPSILDVL